MVSLFLFMNNKSIKSQNSNEINFGKGRKNAGVYIYN